MYTLLERERSEHTFDVTAKRRRRRERRDAIYTERYFGTS